MTETTKMMLPMAFAFATAGLVYLLVRARTKEPRQWAAGAFFVYYAIGWVGKSIYEAISNPRFGAPPEIFIVFGIVGALGFGLIVRSRIGAGVR